MHALFTLLLLIPLVSAHINLKYPVPINHPDNPNTNKATADSNYNSPIKAAEFPCKGYHKLLGTPAGRSVATWAAGSTQNFTLSGTAVHGGGSCQASISEDGGQTFRVVRSYVGGCPAIGKAFEFVVPKEARSGVALFAWTWFNNIGNREMYMNCAAVTISDGGSKGLSGLPEIFQANLGSGCETVPNKDLLFPAPGNDAVIVNPAATAPVGACELSAPAGANTSSSISSASSASSAPSAPSVPSAPSAPSAPSVPSAPSAPSAAATTPLTPVSSPSRTTFTTPTGCMCICGGPSGYALNILPVSAVDNVVEKTPAVLIIDQLPTVTDYDSSPSSPVPTPSSHSTTSAPTSVTLSDLPKGKSPTATKSSSGKPKRTSTFVKISRSGGVSVTKTSLSVDKEPTGAETGLAGRFRRW